MLDSARYLSTWGPGRKPKRSSAGAWGDGLVNRSISSLYYPCTWSEVSEDELAFLWPSLQDAPRGEAGAHQYFRSTLAARLHDLVCRCGGASDDDADGAVLRTVRRSGVVKSASLEQLRAEGFEAWSRCYHRLPPSDPARHAPSFWIYELSVLASLDRALAAASGAPASEPDVAGLSDALVASIYAGVNAAYAYPRLAFAHELFTVGAWLGQLLRGRAALMPASIAERLIDHLGSVTSPPAGDAGLPDRLIHYHAEAAVGAKRLLLTAKRVFRSGSPALVRPSAGAADRLPRPVWDDALTNFSVAN